MTSVHDVAAYILRAAGEPITTMKLQKLAYYCQAWHAAWNEGEQLFPEEFQAWANGPVCFDLYAKHKRRYSIDAMSFSWGDPERISSEDKADIDAVLEAYMPLSGTELSIRTHQEQPWIMARGGRPPGAQCDAEITVKSMADFYGGMADDPDAALVVDAVRPSWAMAVTADSPAPDVGCPS